MTDRPVMDKRQLERTVIYDKFMRPQGWHGAMNLCAAQLANRFVCNIWITRSRRQEDWERADLDAYSHFAPHPCCAVAVHGKLAVFRRAILALTQF
jgi:hypothetical protein